MERKSVRTFSTIVSKDARASIEKIADCLSTAVAAETKTFNVDSLMESHDDGLRFPSGKAQAASVNLLKVAIIRNIKEFRELSSMATISSAGTRAFAIEARGWTYICRLLETLGELDPTFDRNDSNRLI